MSEELLAKIVAERNVLKDKLAAQQVKLTALKDENALKVGDLKQKLKDAEKREFNVMVDAKYYKSECSRHIAQRNLAMARVKELETTIDAMKRVTDAV